MADYRVFTDHSIEHFDLSVKSALQEGWKLAGGVSTFIWDLDEDGEKLDQPRVIYCQAVYKD